MTDNPEQPMAPIQMSEGKRQFTQSPREQLAQQRKQARKSNLRLTQAKGKNTFVSRS